MGPSLRLALPFLVISCLLLCCHSFFSGSYMSASFRGNPAPSPTSMLRKTERSRATAGGGGGMGLEGGFRAGGCGGEAAGRWPMLRLRQGAGARRRRAGIVRMSLSDDMWMDQEEIAKAARRQAAATCTSPDIESAYNRSKILSKLRSWWRRGEENIKEDFGGEELHGPANISLEDYRSLTSHHFMELGDSEVQLDISNALGSGSYGVVFRGKLKGGENDGLNIVAKRAHCLHGGLIEQEGNLTTGELDERIDEFVMMGTARRTNMDLGFKYLEVEAYMNDLVMHTCPEAAAPYLGMVMINGSRWLVWEYIGGDTLEDVLVRCDEVGSLEPLALSLGYKDFQPGDKHSLHVVVNLLAERLLECCISLEAAGVAHRDIKPLNLLCMSGRIVLIDFGSAAAMGISGRVGYDWSASPCDPRYAPPEKFIDEKQWEKFDLFSVGLILVRVLFPPLWDGNNFDRFSDSFHTANFDLDKWLKRIIKAEEGLMGKTEVVGGWLPKGGILRGLMRGGSPNGREREESLDGAYVKLATQSCATGLKHLRGDLVLCNMRDGLELLNDEDTGVCWRTLRSMLARHPAERMAADEALNKVVTSLEIEDDGREFEVVEKGGQETMDGEGAN